MPTPNLKTFLKDRLSGAAKVAVLGIGSSLRGDDVAGMLVIEYLKKNPASRRISKRIGLFGGATAPENLTGEIRAFKPGHIIIVDSAEMKEKPGTILVLRPEEIGGGVTFSTHNMPARILSEYFKKSVKCGITIIGIQPRSVRFGDGVSRLVKSASKEVAEAIACATNS